MAGKRNNTEVLQNVPLVRLPEGMTLTDLYPRLTEEQKRQRWEELGFGYSDGDVILVEGEGKIPDWLK